MTFVFALFFKKYSAKRHALVFESSPPITTRPSKSSAVQFLSDESNYSGVSILCLPEPKILVKKMKSNDEVGCRKEIF